MLEKLQAYLITKTQSNTTIFIDDIVSETGADKAVIFQAMKNLEAQSIGSIIVGRRGGRTRFEVGKEKENSKYAVVLAVSLEKIIKTKQTNFVIEAESLESKFQKKDIVNAFKMLEAKGFGVFLVGRKGSKSRFEVGKTKEIKKTSTRTPKHVNIPDEQILVKKPIRHQEKNTNEKWKIRIFGKSVFLIASLEGFDSFESAFKNSGLENNFKTEAEMNAFKMELTKFGLAKL